jgi:hypothetical protein
MWWVWPHLRRLWAATGAVIVGLTVTCLYNLWTRQAVPDLSSLYSFLHDYWVWAGGSLIALAAVSVFAEQAHRRHEARAPKPLRTSHGPIRAILTKLRRSSRAAAQLVSTRLASPVIVGREADLARLGEWFAQVKAGNRRVIFVSGEPGIGKTTLVRTFIDSIADNRSSPLAIRIGRGQCVEQYGAGEPYMPVLEALTGLCREPGGGNLVAILHGLAPAWLAQMPSLVSAEDRLRLQGQAQGTTQQRMLREIVEALEVMAAETPLILLLEDLHWSDPSTLDLIAAIARRTELARLLILGTYRPVEMLANEHPLRTTKAELELHQHCQELRLKLLGEPEVIAYLAQRFGDHETQQVLERR